MTIRQKIAIAEQLDALIGARSQRYVSAFDIATVYSAQANRAAALDWLETAVEERAQPIGFLHVDPAFKWLRAEPRVQRILQRLG